jgi:hypothetical protein
VNVKKRMSIEIGASPEDVWRVLAEDRRDHSSDDGFHTRTVLTEGPLRVGSKHKDSVQHDGHECYRVVTTTRFEPPYLLEEQWEHTCTAAGRMSRGGWRYELHPSNGSTLLVCSSTTPIRGLRGLIFRLFPSLSDHAGIYSALQTIRHRAVAGAHDDRGGPSIEALGTSTAPPQP